MSNFPKQSSNSYRLLFVFTKILVFTYSFSQMKNNLLEYINFQWDSIVSENTCFQSILIENREKTSK